MPSVTTTFIDLLMYIAPGFVLLYALRRHFPAIDKLIGPSGQPPASIEALVPLLLMTIAAGVVVAALSQILIRGVGFMARRGKRRPKQQRIEMYRSILANDPEKLTLFYSFVRNMQANAAMATALVVSVTAMLYHHLSGATPMAGGWAKFAVVVGFTVAMLTATGMSLGTIGDVMEAFSNRSKTKE